MSTASFLAKMGIAKMGQIGDSITSAIVNFDPETASRAQIDEYRDHCSQIEHKVAQAEAAVTTATAATTNLQVKLDRAREAAKAMRAMINASPDQTAIAAMQAQAATVITQIKQIGGETMDGASSGDLFEAKADLDRARADLAEWTSVHQQAIQQLTNAENTLRHAKDDLARAQREKERAEERARQEDENARLRSGLGSGNGVALDAMAASAAKAREAARAATLHAEALHTVKGGDADAIVAETLAKQKPPSSVMDDLNNL